MLRAEVVEQLRDLGFNSITHYSSVDPLQDTYGIEVCGIKDEDDAVAILRMLEEMFPSWNEGWTRCGELGRGQGLFSTAIQRDWEPPRDHWEPGRLAIGQFVDHHIYELPYSEGGSFRIGQGYGGSFTHRGRSYYCLDFSMPINTPICAARSGIVVETIDEFADGGDDWSYRSKCNRAVISHEDGSSAHYCHLMKGGLAVRLDQRVQAGDTIGLSGNSGRSRGPHLHFSVDWLGEPIPTRFRTLEAACIMLEQGKRYTRPYGPGKKWRARLQRMVAFLRTDLW